MILKVNIPLITTKWISSMKDVDRKCFFKSKILIKIVFSVSGGNYGLIYWFCLYFFSRLHMMKFNLKQKQTSEGDHKKVE